MNDLNVIHFKTTDTAKTLCGIKEADMYLLSDDSRRLGNHYINEFLAKHGERLCYSCKRRV